MRLPSMFFPVSADDFVDHPIDLNAVCVQHSAATFFLRASGDAMKGAGIFDGDLLIVDRSLDVQSGAAVVAIVDGAFTVKRLTKAADGRVFLAPEPAACSAAPVAVPVTDEMEIWGVVTFVVHRV